MEEAEFEEMWAALQNDLPNSFRFTGTKSDALAVREIFKQRYIPAISAQTFEGKPVPPPEPVPAAGVVATGVTLPCRRRLRRGTSPFA